MYKDYQISDIVKNIYNRDVVLTNELVIFVKHITIEDCEKHDIDTKMLHNWYQSNKTA